MDLINRQDAIDALNEEKINRPLHSDRWVISDCLNDIMGLPSVQPERKIGHWIDTGSGQECSECHEIQYGYDSGRFYCANCGAMMVEYETV